MKVIFMGTPEFAVPTLESLIKHHNVAAVVCQPDRPNNRGNKIIFGAVKQLALGEGISVFQPESVKEQEFINELSILRPDVIVVAAYGQLLPKEILSIPKYGCINVHASLLPKYRGAAPIQWAIINGENQTGVTIMRMSKGLDSGDMIIKHHISIEPYDTYGSLSEKIALSGAETLITALEELKNGMAKTVMQNDAEATYAPLIKKEIGRIKWENNGKDIVNLIRGLNPSPGAYSQLEGEKVKIWQAEIFDKSDDKSDYGVVLDVLQKKGVIVNAKNESIIITELQASGGKKLPASDYIRGRRVTPGMILC